MGELPEYVDGLPNLCGSERLVEAAIAAGRNRPVLRDGMSVDIAGIDSAFAVALLRLVGARHADAPPWAYGQNAKASSSNAPASRRCTSSSTASSYPPRRRFCTNACPAITIPTLWSCLSPRIGRSRAFSRP
jgi:hypothetical protein